MKTPMKALPSIALPPETSAESPGANAHEGRGTHR